MTRALGRSQLILLICLATVGCQSVLGIRPPIPTILQGNVYRTSDIEKLSVGLTTNQVLYVLGSPLLQPFDQPDTWFYYRAAVRQNKTQLRQLLVLRFKEDRLASWEESLLNENIDQDLDLATQQDLEQQLQKIERGTIEDREFELPEDQQETDNNPAPL
ncbi:MAG: outer membrane protein assembly factor BamE [Gammaproteobacteria bacterium]